MRPEFEKYLFWFSILALAYTYGFISHSKQIFPYRLIEEARIACEALLEMRQEDTAQSRRQIIEGIDFWEESGATGPTVDRLSEQAGSETILVVGSDKANLDLNPENGCFAWLMDRQGSILHAWTSEKKLWRSIPGRAKGKKDWYAYPLGAHLYPNGDILVSFQGENVFPIAVGLAKFDRDSKLLWKNSGFFHHWFSVDERGYIYVPTAQLAESPFGFPDHLQYFECPKKYFNIDSITILDPSGRFIKEIDLFQAFVDSDLAGVFHSSGGHRHRIRTCDPMHLNDIRILTPEMAPEFPDFQAGDLLLSFRSLNGIGVLDPQSERFRWFYTGALHNPHSPRFYRDNRILVFDNLGGKISRGISRIVAIDVSLGGSVTLFPKPGAPLPERRFYSKNAGHLDLHPDRRRLLASWTHQGLIWEIDLQQGEVLWEYVNIHPIQGHPARVPVYTARYIPGLDFSLNHGRLNRTD